MTPIEKVREALWWAHIEISAQLVKEGCTYKEMGNYVTLREIEAAQRELEGKVIAPIKPTAPMYSVGSKFMQELFGDDPYYIKTHKKMAIKLYKLMIAPYLPEQTK